MLSPRMRCQRVAVSITVWSSMWPMCSDPVTLGGGTSQRKSRAGRVGIGVKNTGLHPPFGPTRLEALRLVCLFQFHGETSSLTS